MPNIEDFVIVDGNVTSFRGTYKTLTIYKESDKLVDISKVKANSVLIESLPNSKVLDSIKHIRYVHITYAKNKKIVIDNKNIKELQLSDCENIDLVIKVNLEELTLDNVTLKSMTIKDDSISKVIIKESEGIDPIALVMGSDKNADFVIDDAKLRNGVVKATSIPRDLLGTLSEII